jgi:hypothetical protein
METVNIKAHTEDISQVEALKAFMTLKELNGLWK